MHLSTLALDCYVGVALHLFVFRHGEWDIFVPTVAVGLLKFGIPLVAGSAIFVVYTGMNIPSAVFLNSAKHSAVVLTALTMSILVYRWQLHRLHAFPGPRRARLSIAHIIWKAASSPNGFRMSQQLHKEYGDFVRVGETPLLRSEPVTK